MSHHQLNTLTDDKFDSLVISHIIYAEISDGGAMGNSGEILIYTLHKNELIPYSTNYSKNENLFKKVEKNCLSTPIN